MDAAAEEQAASEEEAERPAGVPAAEEDAFVPTEEY